MRCKRKEKKHVKLLIVKAKYGDAEAQYELALRYYCGRGVKGDWQKTFYWIFQAAEGGCAKAQSHMGRAYQYERFALRRNLEKAEYWYKLAAAQGEETAQEMLYLLQKSKENRESIKKEPSE